MIECYHCGVEFTVKFEDGDASPLYCPSCGNDLDESHGDWEDQLELDFED